MELIQTCLFLLACCTLITAQQLFDPLEARWGLHNGQLIDTFDGPLTATIGGPGVGVPGFGVGGALGGGVAGIGVGGPIGGGVAGIGMGGAIRGGVAGGRWGNLPPCRFAVCPRRQWISPECRYIPIHRHSTPRACRGCPIDLCAPDGRVGPPLIDRIGGGGFGLDVGLGLDGLGQNLGLGSLSGRRGGLGRRGREGRARRGRGRGGRGRGGRGRGGRGRGQGSRRGGLRRIQRQICRRLGVCTFGSQRRVELD